MLQVYDEVFISSLDVFTTTSDFYIQRPQEKKKTRGMNLYWGFRSALDFLQVKFSRVRRQTENLNVPNTLLPLPGSVLADVVDRQFLCS